MANTKKHLIFDLDDTIWDFKRNSKETLLGLYQDYKLADKGVDSSTFLQTFKEVNTKLWDQFDEGTITRDVIRKKRFHSVLDKLAINHNGEAMQMQDEFMQRCSTSPFLVEGALQVLKHFQSTYTFHILSNGFDEIQFVKLKSSGITHFFDKIITSGRAGFRKPQSEIFEFALNEIGASKEECIMIGDNPLADIEGAYRFGMDQVYYNTHKKECAITPTFTIQNFNELLNLL